MTTTITEPTVSTAFMATTSRDALESATKFVAAGLPARAPIPVLNGVLLEATDSGITVTGFDFELATRQRIAGFGDGRVLVTGKLLKDVVGKLAKGSEVTLLVTDGKLEVRSGTRTYRLPLLALEDYPDLPELPAPVAVLAADDLAKLAKVTVAAAVDDTITILTAIRMDFSAAARKVTVAATDRYRLAVLTLDTATTFTGSAQAPAVSVNFAIKQLAKRGNVTIGVTPTVNGWGGVSFSAGDREIIIRVLDGEFPKYQKLLPSSSEARLVVDTNLLLQAVDGAGVVLDRNRAVRVALDITGATLHAGAFDGEIQHSEYIGGTYEGEPMVTAYNPKYLVDGVKAVGTQAVTVSLTTAGKPSSFTDAANPSYTYVLMPVRISA